MTGEFVMRGHLGGYFAGGDPDTLYPQMWAYVLKRESVTSILDVGCGDGTAVDWFLARGVDAFGIDGVAQENPRVMQHDYTTGDARMRDDAAFDLVWSCEFVEHVDAEHVDNFMVDMARAPLVLMTHAVPGQTGHHHVNCQDATYWIDAFARHGYAVDFGLTGETRARAHSYYAATGMAFRRSEER